MQGPVPSGTITAWKRAVACAFDRAEDYDAAARIQAVAAERLADAIAGQPLASAPCTLEIGCGTGLLTASLRVRLALGPMLVTDVAPAMTARCRSRLGPVPEIGYAVMDGEGPCLREASFDLVASSLAAQWFADLPGALARLASLLRPGGLLAVATLAEGTLSEWRQAQGGRAHATPAFPTVEALRRLRFEGCASEVRLDRLRESHADGRAFLRALRAIGAGTPAVPASQRSAGALRRALRAFEAQGASVTYAVAIVLIRRGTPPGRQG